ncbi:phage late control D family protein [Paenibacillus sp. MER 99-2]|uniref:phage late control D family protein n=1 Tax=Paenibacillus sp. MER 99-2 TaxID=2939572 RepID=UPI00203BAD47|nr:phage late control D family protein [Paenibacillus sp. MER 99-2]MCM3170796.1 phage late control D family protein [Paenibacillus sp. MER 99-2]
MQNEEQSTLTYEDILIHWPYGPVRLDRLQWVQQAGTHARLSFSGWIDEDWEETILQQAGSHDRVGFIRKDNTGREIPLFKGQLHDISIEAFRGMTYVRAVVISHTYELDTFQRTRSFQNENLRYLDIVHRVMDAYPEGDYIDYALEENKTGVFLMQYQETDWAFLKRIASHMGADLIPDVTAHKPRFWIGYPEGIRSFELKELPYEKARNLENYLHTVAHEQHQVNEEQYTTFTFNLGQELQPGDEVSCDGATYLINRREAVMDRGLLQWTYTCALPTFHPLTKKLQTDIIGASIDGKIIDVKRNQVKVHLDMDEDQQAGEARWFPYAAEGSQVWYMMPEHGAKVKLYFPSAEEDEAMVMQSVREEPKEATHAAKSSKVMQDPGVKSFGNPQGKSFTLGDSELVMTAQEGSLYISMAAGNGVTLNSTTHIQIQSMGDVNISGGNVSLTGAEGLFIQTATDHVELVEEVNGKSEKVLLEAEIHRSFEMIESAFDQALASMGEAVLKQERLARNWELRHQSELNRNIDEGKSLLRMVGDVADILYTGLEGPDQVRATYSSFKDGGYVGPLEERNATWQGLVKTWDYASDVVTLQKSWGELGNDALGVASEFINPLMNQAKKDPITMLTFTEEESKQAGVSDAEANLAQLDIAGMALGGSSLVKKSAMKINKLGRKSDHGDGSGPKGFLHGDGDGPDSTSAVLKDGKFKTNAALLPPSLNELGELIAKAVGKMTEGAAASIPWRIRYVQLPDGGNVPVIMKMDKQGSSGNRKEDLKGGTEGTGKDLLSPNGNFIDSKLESDYQKYLARKAKEGKTARDRLDWKQEREYWLNDSPMARGNAFNNKAEEELWYPFNEVHLSTGKRVDSYDPITKEIVSRKATNLESIDQSTFESYLKELKNKYPSGTVIRSNKYPEIDGQPLTGKQILEIPDSNKNFDKMQEYIELAKSKYNVEIRFREE